MPARKKNGLVIAVFDTKARAEQAIAELRQAGFKDDQLGMMARGADGKVTLTDGSDETLAEEGAVTGAVAGAGAGALIGAGVLAGVIPVVGPVLAIGAVGTILLNAAVGAAVAGIAGALIGWGFSEEDAAWYESEVKAGRYLVTVRTTGARADKARDILNRFEGFDHTRRGATTEQSATSTNAGTSARTTGARPVTSTLAGEGERTVELREEQVTARKTPVHTGDVEVRKEVTTEHRTIQVPVEREEVVIERRPVGGRATTAIVGEEEIRIPVKEEKVNITKEAVVKEEVSIGKRKVRDTVPVSADVRKEELVVESEGDAQVRHTTDRKKK